MRGAGVHAGTSAPRLESLRDLVADEGCGALEQHQIVVDVEAASASVPVGELSVVQKHEHYVSRLIQNI